MTLRRRILLALGLTLLGLVSGLTLLSRSLLMADYARLEQQSVTQNAQRTQQTFEQMLSNLHEKSSDWASWDDTYQFMRDHNARYITSNLTATALKSLQLEMVAYVDTQGRLFHVTQIKRLRAVPAVSPQKILASLDFPNAASQWKAGHEFATVMPGSDVPLMLSVRPITPTDPNGKQRGWLIMARHFDSGLLAQLCRQTRLDVSCLQVQNAAVPQDSQATLRQLPKAHSVATRIVDDNALAGYIRVDGLHGTPVLLLKTVQARDIYQRGAASVTLLLRLIVGCCLVFSFVLLRVLELTVLKRLSHLGTQLETIADKQTHGMELTALRVVLSGRDELNILGERINGLLDALETHSRRLRDTEEEIRAQNETLEQTVADRVAELRERSEVLENVVEGIARLDSEGNFVSANTAYTAMLEYLEDELLGKHWIDTIYAPDIHKMESAFRMLSETDKVEVQLQGIQRDGWIIHQQTVMVAIRNDAGELSGSYLFTKDVSERTGLEAQIAHQAYHDSLTGLPNRTLFMERLVSAQQWAKRKSGLLAVVFIDLDNFKIVNDSLGHEAGDALLMIVSERLLESVRPGDTVSRLGGDEFTLLLENVPSTEAIVEIAERIMETLGAPILLPQKELFVTASIGIAYTDGQENLTEDTLLRHADTAMYYAKAQGKSDYALFDPSMNAHVVERMEIETGLRLAIEHGEFEVYYQPLIDLESGRITGAESLVRWNHPERGIVSPSQFIPIAEETGLICPIGYIVLEEACRQWIKWSELFGAGFDFMMNVNLSGRQLQRPDVVERVTEIITATQIPPHFLKLEITESVIMENMDDVIVKLNQFRTMGIKLAIDDFGTGYSSMSSLSLFPVNTVKIDKAFVQQLGVQEEANAVVAALIMLSKTLKMDVTAEGIEQKDQLMQLQALGCNIGQGFYFARPCDRQEFTDLLEIGLPFRFETDALQRSHIEKLLETYLPAEKAA